MSGSEETFLTASTLLITVFAWSIGWPVLGQDSFSSRATKGGRSLNFFAVYINSSSFPLMEPIKGVLVFLIRGYIVSIHRSMPGLYKPTLLIAPPPGKNLIHDCELHGNHVRGRLHDKLLTGYNRG